MRAIRSKDTKPEMRVRRLVHGMGYRYRLHGSHLPGNPDLVFGPRRKVIFVHGCFWHGHHCKRGDRLPKSNRTYWTNKIQESKRRDSRNLESLHHAGWRALIVWECQLKHADQLAARVRSYLDGGD